MASGLFHVVGAPLLPQHTPCCACHSIPRSPRQPATWSRSLPCFQVQLITAVSWAGSPGVISLPKPVLLFLWGPPRPDHLPLLSACLLCLFHSLHSHAPVSDDVFVITCLTLMQHSPPPATFLSRLPQAGPDGATARQLPLMPPVTPVSYRIAFSL